MGKNRDSKVAVKEVFDDVALLFGSVAVARRLPDELIKALISRLGRVRLRTLRRLSDDRVHGDRQTKAEPPRLHPAVESFLIRNGPGGAESVRKTIRFGGGRSRTTAETSTRR